MQPPHNVFGEEYRATLLLIPGGCFFDRLEDHKVRVLKRVAVREAEYIDELVAEDLEVDPGRGGSHVFWSREYLHEDDLPVYTRERELARAGWQG